MEEFAPRANPPQTAVPAVETVVEADGIKFKVKSYFNGTDNLFDILLASAKEKRGQDLRQKNLGL